MTGERHGMQIIFHPLVTLFRASQIREKETSDTCSWLLFYVSSISLDLLCFVVVDREKTIFFMMYLYMSHLSLKRERFRVTDLSKIRSSSLISFFYRRIDSFRD